MHSYLNSPRIYTSLPHNWIKDKRIDLIERTFQRECPPYLACNDRNAFFTSTKPKKYHAWSCQNICTALIFLLDNLFILFGTKLYRQVVGIPMDTNCAAMVADLFLFYLLCFFFCIVFAMSLCASGYMCFVVTCWERADLLALVCGVYFELVTFPLVSWVRCGTWLYRFLIFAPLLTLLWEGFMMSLSGDKQADVINAFNTTSRYFEDILNIKYVYFDNMVS